jgi:plasmid stabilization system protein ParE
LKRRIHTQRLAGKPDRKPQLGAKLDSVREGYRVLFVRSHAIYYTVSDSAIHVIRVLHRRMDPGLYL